MQMRIILKHYKDNDVWDFAPVQCGLGVGDGLGAADGLGVSNGLNAGLGSATGSTPLTGSGPVTVRRLRVSLGTLVALQATGASALAAQSAVEAAFAVVSEIDRRLHPHSADSDLARISNSPLHAAVTVHPDTRYLLDLAHRLNLLTNGVFDPCLPLRAGRLQDIEVAGEQIVCHAPVALDFGGFAKGYAVDRAIDVLMGHGCTAGLVNAGGDLRVFGLPAEPILLRGQGGDFTQMALTDAALAVSDVKSEHRPAEHQGYYVHGNDSPLVTDYAAVVAKQAVIADALAKCVLFCPHETAESVLRVFDARRLVIQ